MEIEGREREAFTTEIGPWMPAIVPAPPVEPMLTVVTVGKLAKLEMLTGSLLATTLTVLATIVPVPELTKRLEPVPVPKTLNVLPPPPPLIMIAGTEFGVPVTLTVPLPAAAVSSTRDVRFWPEKLATVLPPRLTVLLVIAYVAPEPPRVSSIVSARSSFPCSC